jgi:hypothetical protein
MKTARIKTDNNPTAKKAKIEIRQRVLAQVKPAKVLDLFCGRGEMYRAVWRNAASYTGCDERPWDWKLDPPRFVADNRRLLRCLDLAQFNIFDLDAYGSPWEQAEIILHRRKWEPGERGGIIVTDGSSLKLRWGQMPKALARIAGVTQGVPTTASVADLQTRALTQWVKKAKVKVLCMWQAQAQAQVLYTGLVFEGS